VMSNYTVACRKRMHLWISDSVSVESVAENTMEIAYQSHRARLVFEPTRCAWSLHWGSNRLDGNFDRLTKRLRQILTTSPLEEEA